MQKGKPWHLQRHVDAGVYGGVKFQSLLIWQRSRLYHDVKRVPESAFIAGYHFLHVVSDKQSFNELTQGALHFIWNSHFFICVHKGLYYFRKQYAALYEFLIFRVLSLHEAQCGVAALCDMLIPFFPFMHCRYRLSYLVFGILTLFFA